MSREKIKRAHEKTDLEKEKIGKGVRKKQEVKKKGIANKPILNVLSN